MNRENRSSRATRLVVLVSLALALVVLAAALVWNGTNENAPSPGTSRDREPLILGFRTLPADPTVLVIVVGLGVRDGTPVQSVAENENEVIISIRVSSSEGDGNDGTEATDVTFSLSAPLAGRRVVTSGGSPVDRLS